MLFRRRVELSLPNVADGWDGGDEWRSWEPPRNAIRGESRYRPALRRLTGSPRRAGYLVPVAVDFVRERENPVDSNAFRAEVSGEHVGYLAREIAAVIAKQADKAGCSSFRVCGVLRGWIARGARCRRPRLDGSAPLSGARDCGRRRGRHSRVAAERHGGCLLFCGRGLSAERRGRSHSEATRRSGRTRVEVRTGVRTRRAFPARPAQLTRSTMRLPLNGAGARGAYGIRTRATAERRRQARRPQHGSDCSR